MCALRCKISRAYSSCYFVEVRETRALIKNKRLLFQGKQQIV